MNRMFLTAGAVLMAVAGVGGAALVAQTTPPEMAGKADPKLVTAGTYTIDGNHTQVLFAFNHMGFSRNMGLFAEAKGTLTLDPAAPQDAKLSVEIPINSLGTGVPKFNEHLLSADFFEATKFPTATFTSTEIKVEGTEAEITGDLTIKGITKPVTLDAEFVAAGAHPMNKKLNVGFTASTTIKRSEFGLGKYVPVVADEVELRIVAAFEK